MPMLVSNPFGEESRSLLVGNELGESYKVVKSVYDKLDTLDAIATDPKVDSLNKEIEAIVNVSNNMETLSNLNSALKPEILDVIPVIPEKAEQATKALEEITELHSSVVDTEKKSQQALESILEAKESIDRTGQEALTTKNEAKAVLGTTRQVQAEVLAVKTQVDSLNREYNDSLGEIRVKHSEVVAKALEVKNNASDVAGTKTLILNKVSEANSSATNAHQSEQEARTILNSLKNMESTVATTAKQVATNKTVVEAKANEAKTSADASARSALEAKQYASDASKGQVQTDWTETNTSAITYIKNKPVLGSLASKNSIAYTEVTGTPNLGSLAYKSSIAYSEVTGTPTLGALASQDDLSYYALSDLPLLGDLAKKDSVSSAYLDNHSVRLSKLASDVTDKFDELESKIDTQTSVVKAELNPKIQKNIIDISSTNTKVADVSRELTEFKNSFGSSDKYVKTEAQSLSESVKTQVRTNIDVYSKSEVSNKISPVSNSLTQVKNTYVKKLDVEESGSDSVLVVTKGDGTYTRIPFSSGSIPEGLALEADVLAGALKASKDAPPSNNPSAIEDSVRILDTRLGDIEDSWDSTIRVIEQGGTDEGWYRLWQNGWLEQGGLMKVWNDNGWHEYTISLLRAYKNTKYTVLGVGSYSSGNAYGFNLCSNSGYKTTTSFRFYGTGGTGDGVTNRPSWYTCGFAR